MKVVNKHRTRMELEVETIDRPLEVTSVARSTGLQVMRGIEMLLVCI